MSNLRLTLAQLDRARTELNDASADVVREVLDMIDAEQGAPEWLAECLCEAMGCRPSSAREVVSVWIRGRNKHERGSWLRCQITDHALAEGRHTILEHSDPGGLDAESGLPHRAHALARAFMAFARRGH